MNGKIVLWDWDQRTVTLRDGLIRDMTPAESAPVLHDARTGEEVLWVISYNTEDYTLVRYAPDKNGRPFVVPSGLILATISEKREVIIKGEGP